MGQVDGLEVGVGTGNGGALAVCAVALYCVEGTCLALQAVVRGVCAVTCGTGVTWWQRRVCVDGVYALGPLPYALTLGDFWCLLPSSPLLGRG